MDRARRLLFGFLLAANEDVDVIVVHPADDVGVDVHVDHVFVVIRLVRGLQILVPDLVGLDDNERIIINASAERVAAAVEAQLDNLHADMDVDDVAGQSSQ